MPVEELIDKMMIIILTNEEIDEFLWSNFETISMLYNDKTFGIITKNIYQLMKQIANDENENDDAIGYVFSELHVRLNINDNSEQALYLWSFLLSTACTIV